MILKQNLGLHLFNLLAFRILFRISFVCLSKLNISSSLFFFISSLKFSRSFMKSSSVAIKCLLLDKNISVHILGSDEPILVKSLKPQAEKFISSFFF